MYKISDLEILKVEIIFRFGNYVALLSRLLHGVNLYVGVYVYIDFQILYFFFVRRVYLVLFVRVLKSWNE